MRVHGCEGCVGEDVRHGQFNMGEMYIVQE